MSIRNCRTCRIDKSDIEFNKDAQIKDGLSTRCKACQSLAWAKNPGRKRTGRKPYIESEHKFCNGCKQTLVISQFRLRTDRQNGRISRCGSCVARAHNEWRDRNPDASRLRNLKSKYGLTGEEYMKMLGSQSGVCAICGSSESGWSTSPFLHVDHDHVTGKVRGLLCHPCNVAVGLVERGVPVDALLAYLGRVA